MFPWDPGPWARAVLFDLCYVVVVLFLLVVNVLFGARAGPGRVLQNPLLLTMVPKVPLLFYSLEANLPLATYPQVAFLPTIHPSYNAYIPPSQIIFIL